VVRERVARGRGTLARAEQRRDASTHRDAVRAAEDAHQEGRDDECAHGWRAPRKVVLTSLLEPLLSMRTTTGRSFVKRSASIVTKNGTRRLPSGSISTFCIGRIVSRSS